MNRIKTWDTWILYMYTTEKGDVLGCVTQYNPTMITMMVDSIILYCLYWMC